MENLGIQPYGQCLGEVITEERKRRHLVPAGWGSDQGLGLTRHILDSGSAVLGLTPYLPGSQASRSPGPPRLLGTREWSRWAVSSILLCWDDAGIEGHSVLRERRSRQRAPMEGPRIGWPHHVFGENGAPETTFSPAHSVRDELRRSSGMCSALYYYGGTVSSRLCVPTPATWGADPQPRPPTKRTTETERLATSNRRCDEEHQRAHACRAGLGIA